MEEQIIKSVMDPRVVLKKNSRGYCWDIGTSSKDDLEEIKKIIKNLKEANQLMNDEFNWEDEKSEYLSKMRSNK
ncbi:MAG: hypothetical protein IIA75_01640 [Proteobacteria bacterium]|nr:hypothetical protein [Pseudomonadota bacterium]